MKKNLLLLFLMLISVDVLIGQVRDYELGAQLTDPNRRNYSGAYFDYSDPEAININVSVWGFVKFPGRYLIPDYTNIIDLMSYVGGPLDDSNLDEVRLYRIDENNNEQMITIDLNDLMWEDELEDRYRDLPQIHPSDILVIPGEPRLYFMNWFSIGLSVFSALISLTILIITIRDK